MIDHDQKIASEECIEDSYIVTFKDAPAEHRAVKAQDTSAGCCECPGDEQSHAEKHAVTRRLNCKCHVVRLLPGVNAAEVLVSADEVEKLRKNPAVKSVIKNVMTTLAGSQSNPGWALDRVDQRTPPLDSIYNWGERENVTPSQLYILDTGLDLSYPTVVAEFGGRAFVMWDREENPGRAGLDCNGHGTAVAACAIGSTYGVAKNQTAKILKITFGCTGSSDGATSAYLVDWLATNAPRGSVISWSHAIQGTYAPLEEAIVRAFDAGIAFIAAAGNDGDYWTSHTPTRIPQTLVAGATGTNRLSEGKDERAAFTRWGQAPNIVFAPGVNVPSMTFNGEPVAWSGTSFSAPMVSGTFARAMQTFLNWGDYHPMSALYPWFYRDLSTHGTVVNTSGFPSSWFPDNFLYQPW